MKRMDFEEAKGYVIRDVGNAFYGETIDPDKDWIVVEDILDYMIDVFKELGYVLVPTNGQV